MLCFGFFMSEKGKKHEILLLSINLPIINLKKNINKNYFIYYI